MTGSRRCEMTNRNPIIAQLADDRAALLVQQPFLAILALQLELTDDPSIPTVCTDGQRLRFNPSFIRGLEPLQRRFVLAHVVWHLALLHPWRRRTRDRTAWDLAADHEVNTLLRDDLPLPWWATLFEDRAHDGADAVHAWLTTLETLPERAPPCDVHQDPVTAIERDRALERRWAENILTAAQQLTRLGRPLPHAIQRLVDALRRPRLHWTEILRRFVEPVLGDQRRWLPPNRRHLHRGVYLPSRKDHRLRVFVGLDTSGSTTHLQAELLSELVGILDVTTRYEMTLAQGDHRLRDLQTYTIDRPLDVEALEPIGGGGTNLEVFFAAIEERHLDPALAIILTDGLGQAPARPPPFPVIWALPTGAQAPANWGELLHFD